MKAITKDRVLELLREGWELGTGGGLRSTVWMQYPHLCRGGESVAVNWKSFHSLLDKGLVVVLPRQAEDAYWLTRYGLAAQLDLAALPTGAGDRQATVARVPRRREGSAGLDSRTGEQ